MRRRFAAALTRGQALISRAVREFFEDGCPRIAAAISYYTLFSLFPLAILTVAGFSLVLGQDEARETVIDFVLDRLPLREDEGRRELAELLEQATGSLTAFGVVALAGLAFAASGLMGAMRHGINAAWGAEERRPPLQGKLLDILLVTGVGAMIVLSLALTFAARLIDLPAVGLAQLVPVGLSFVVFLFLYRVLPSSRTSLGDVWPGALTAAVGYELAKVGFSFYLDNFANYGAVYGSIGAVIAFLVFALLAASLFLLGAEIASEWPAVRRADPEQLAGGPPLGERLRSGLRGLVRSGGDDRRHS